MYTNKKTTFQNTWQLYKHHYSLELHERLKGILTLILSWIDFVIPGTAPTLVALPGNSRRIQNVDH